MRGRFVGVGFTLAIVVVAIGLGVVVLRQRHSGAIEPRGSALPGPVNVAGVHRYPETRVLRRPLVAFSGSETSTFDGHVRPEWIRLPEGRRRAVLMQGDARLESPVEGFAGGRLLGEVGVLPRAGASRRDRVRVRVSLSGATGSRVLLERTLDEGHADSCRVSLPQVLPRGARLVLSTEHLGGPGTEPATVAWIGPTLVGIVPRRRRPPSEAPSIVLITSDTTRADELGVYGGSTRTPTLDALAASGAHFTEVHSVAFGTAPSHASLFTSGHALDHRIYDNETPLDARVRTLAEVLRDGGYSTAAFVGASPLAHSLGFDQGFDVYDDGFALDPESGLGAHALVERRASSTVSLAIDWLDVHGGEAFFLWLHLYDPHQPYAPPPERAQPYLPRELVGREHFQAVDGTPPRLRPSQLAGLPLEERAAVTELARGLYRGEIAYVDEQVGRLLEAVWSRSRSRSVVVAFTADHGENFDERDPELAFGHRELHREVTRVPLILHAPGLVPAGARDARLAASIDVAPTLLGLVDMPIPASFTGDDLLTRASARDRVFLEGAEHSMVGVRTSRWFYRQLLGEWFDSDPPESHFELYDLEADRGETHDVFRPDHPAVLELAPTVDEFFAARDAAEPVPPLVSERHTDALRQLGYVE